MVIVNAECIRVWKEAGFENNSGHNSSSKCETSSFRIQLMGLWYRGTDVSEEAVDYESLVSIHRTTS
jgi:hypothetical protein